MKTLLILFFMGKWRINRKSKHCVIFLNGSQNFNCTFLVSTNCTKTVRFCFFVSWNRQAYVKQLQKKTLLLSNKTMSLNLNLRWEIRWKEKKEDWKRLKNGLEKRKKYEEKNKKFFVFRGPTSLQNVYKQSSFFF